MGDTTLNFLQNSEIQNISEIPKISDRIIIILNEIDNPDVRYDSPERFPNSTRRFIQMCWKGGALWDDPYETEDPNYPKIYYIPKKNVSYRQIHHVTPVDRFNRNEEHLYKFAWGGQHYDLISEAIPIPRLRNIILKDHNHPLNGIPYEACSHSVIHNPQFNQHNKIMLESILIEEGCTPREITLLMRRYDQFAPFIGLANWTYQVNNFLYIANTIMMKKAIHYFDGLPKIKKQYIQDIHNVFDIVVKENFEEFEQVHEYLMTQGAISKYDFEITR